MKLLPEVLIIHPHHSLNIVDIFYIARTPFINLTLVFLTFLVFVESFSHYMPFALEQLSPTLRRPKIHFLGLFNGIDALVLMDRIDKQIPPVA